MITATTYTDLINLYADRLTAIRTQLETLKDYGLNTARHELRCIAGEVEQACNDAGKNWGPILSEGVNIKAASRAMFIQRINEALEGLEGLKAALIKYSGEDARQAKAEAPEAADTHPAVKVKIRKSRAWGEYRVSVGDAHYYTDDRADALSTCAAMQREQGLPVRVYPVRPATTAQEAAWSGGAEEATCFARGSDVLETSGVRVALPVCTSPCSADTDQSPTSHQTDEREFINRTVTALDDAPMGTHSVYVHWFRIDYGCWLDAEEVVNAGGLADYLEESLGLSAADVAELMVRDWDCQDAEGLAARCIGNYGGFDWLKLEELLEVDVEPAVLVAGLACGLEPEAIEDAYMGEWDSDEDMAAEQWEQGGMLDGVPDAVRSYIDWELVARDMLLGSDVVEANGHYFRAA